MQFRRSSTGVAVFLAFAVWAPSPVQAAQTGTIRVGAMPGVSATRMQFVRDQCQTTQTVTALNGSDAAIVNVSARPAGTILRISWDGVAPPLSSLSAAFFTSACDYRNPLSTGGGTTPGIFHVQVPPGAAWLVLEGFRVANVTFSIP